MERFDATLDRIERRLKEMPKEVENVRLLRQHGPWTALQAYLLRLEDKSERHAADPGVALLHWLQDSC